MKNGECEKCVKPFVEEEGRCVIENCLEWENEKCSICQ